MKLGGVISKTSHEQQRRKVAQGTTMSAPRLGKKPDVELAARYIGGTVSASRRSKKTEEFTTEQVRPLGPGLA